MLVRPLIDPTDSRVRELLELTELLGTARKRLVAKQHRLVRELHAAGATPTQLSEWIGLSPQRVHQIVVAGREGPRRDEEADDDRNPGST